MSGTAKRTLVQALAVIAVLGLVAAATPAPASSDREIYQEIGRHGLIRDCADAHCFRLLIAAVLEHLPGRSLIKWKAYAVLANAGAALAVGRFCLLLGLSPSAAAAGTWVSALGAGSLYSLFDCYTSDPLMYMLGPLMAIALWQRRHGRAGLMGSIGVFAKEFAAAPLWIFTVMAAFERRWATAVRLLLTATAVTLVWLSWHTSLMALLNYRYGATASADLPHGGFLATWLRSVGPAGAMTYIFLTFGALHLLLPVGWIRSGRSVRMLAVASVPAAAAFVYVEQPERALWNFHFVVIPVAVVALQALPAWMRGLFVTCFGVANLRFGAQLPIRGLARVSLILSLLIAIIAVAMAVRKATQPTGEPSRDDAAARSPARAWSLVAGQAIAVAVLALVLIDVHAHRRVETDFGVNQWGYRGPIQSVKHPGVRIAFVGGSVAFAAETPWAGTIAAQLASAVNGKQRWTRPGGPFASVDNLAEPAASADSYVATLRDYDYLDPDIVCVFDGYDAGTGGAAARGRRASLVFRSIGYLPMASTPLVDPAGSLSNPAGGVARASQDDGLPDAIDPSCAGSSAPYCAAIAETVRFVIQRRKAIVVATPPYVSARHEAQQRSLAEYLDRQFGHEPRFRYVNLGSIIDLRDRAQSADGLHLTVAASRTVAARLADALIPPIKHRGL